MIGECALFANALVQIALHASNYSNANPSISRDVEKMKIAVYSSLLSDVKNDCPEKVKVLKRSSFAILEHKDPHLRQDSFNYSPDGKLVSWLRLYTDGTSAVFNF